MVLLGPSSFLRLWPGPLGRAVLIGTILGSGRDLNHTVRCPDGKCRLYPLAKVPKAREKGPDDMCDKHSEVVDTRLERAKVEKKNKNPRGEWGIRNNTAPSKRGRALGG